MPEGAIRDKNICLCGLGYDSRYGDLLGAERSGDPVPLEARFFPPSPNGFGVLPVSSMGTGSHSPSAPTSS